jgi:hypothetical protein
MNTVSWEQVKKEMEERTSKDVIKWHLRHWTRPARIRDLIRNVRWASQRVRRGYSDRDTWSLDYFLTTIIPPAVRQLSEEMHGVPSAIVAQHDSIDTAMRAWREVLSQIADGFEARMKLTEDMFVSESERSELEARWTRGAVLFIAHFEALWD